MTDLISRAYSNISLTDASRMLGLTTEETIEYGQKQGWLYAAGSDHIVIKRQTKQSDFKDPLNQQNKIHIDAELMSKLTDYIIFLESTTHSS